MFSFRKPHFVSGPAPSFNEQCMLVSFQFTTCLKLTKTYELYFCFFPEIMHLMTQFENHMVKTTNINYELTDLRKCVERDSKEYGQQINMFQKQLTLETARADNLEMKFSQLIECAAVDRKEIDTLRNSCRCKHTVMNKSAKNFVK